MFGIQLVVVDAHHHGHVGAFGRGRDNDLLGAGFEVLRRRFALREDPGAFERDIDPELAPRQFRRIALGGDADLAAADIHPIVAARDLAREAAMNAVILQQMRIGRDWPQIVDADHLDLAVLVLVSRAQDQPADAAETVDRNPYRHDRSPKPSAQLRSEPVASASRVRALAAQRKRSSVGNYPSICVRRLTMRSAAGRAKTAMPRWHFAKRIAFDLLVVGTTYRCLRSPMA